MMRYCPFILLVLFDFALQAQPVALSDQNPHYLFYHGRPLLIVSSGEHYGAVLNLDFDFEKYLNTLNKEGMNYTRTFSGFYMETPGQFGIKNNSLAPNPLRLVTPWARSDEPGYKNGGNKFNLDKWDDSYFTRLKKFVGEAQKRNIIVEMVLFTSIYNEENWSILPFNPENNINRTKLKDFRKVNTMSDPVIFSYQEKMVRKIITELQSCDNVIYEIQNEPWADNGVSVININAYDPESEKQWVRNVDVANDASLEWQHKIAGVITSEESKFQRKYLISQNYCNFKYPVTEVDPSVSIMNFHYVYPENVNMNYGYNRVISFDESGFAGSDTKTYRQQAWNFILAGGGIFNNLDYSFYPGYEDGTGTNDAPGGGDPALRRQLKILHDFMLDFDFVNLKPDTNVISLAPGLSSQALSIPGKQYAVYLQGNYSGKISLSIPAGNYEASWYNIENGSQIAVYDLVVSRTEVSVQLPIFHDAIALKILAR
jgi:hypothetical protein